MELLYVLNLADAFTRHLISWRVKYWLCTTPQVINFQFYISCSQVLLYDTSIVNPWAQKNKVSRNFLNAVGSLIFSFTEKMFLSIQIPKEFPTCKEASLLISNEFCYDTKIIWCYLLFRYKLLIKKEIHPIKRIPSVTNRIPLIYLNSWEFLLNKGHNFISS